MTFTDFAALSALPSESFRWAPSDVLPPDRRNRIVPLPDGRSLEFKTREDAAVSTIELPADGTGGLVLDLAGTQREVRLLLPLRRLPAVRNLDSETWVRFSVRFDLSGAPGSKPAQWVAILQRNGAEGLSFWRKIAQDVAPGENRDRQWSFAIADDPRQTPEDLILAVQFAPDAGAMRLGRLSIAPLALETPWGAFDLSAEGLVQGWFHSEPGRRDPALIGLKANGQPVEIGIADGVDGFALGRGADRVGFSVPRDRLDGAFAAAGAPEPVKALLLYANGAPAAFTRLTEADDDDEAAEPPVELAPPAGSPAGAESAAAVWAHGPETAARLLAGEPPPGFVRDLGRLLYEQKNIEGLWTLCDLCPEIDRTPPPPGTARLAYLRFFFARLMLEMNAAETAYRILAALCADPGQLAFLDPTDVRRARLLVARAAQRTGRIDEAAQTLRELSANDPTDWECYLHLGVVAGQADAKLRSLYFRVAEALAQKVPPTVCFMLVANLLEEGRPDEALIKALVALKADRNEREMQLCLGNVYQALGLAEERVRCVDRFFAFYGLSGPGPGSDSLVGLGGHIRPIEATALARAGGPLVTVIMTTFNSEATVEAAARSVLAQTHTNLRLVVVDDVSTDATCAIVSTLAAQDARISLLRNQANAGTYCSKNRALEVFEGAYCTFHDSDDWMHPDRIAQHVALMERNAEAVCSTSLWYRMDERGYAMVRRGGGFLHENPASTFLRREVVDRLGLFDSVRAGADSEFMWRVRRVYGIDRVVEISKPLAIGLHHAQSITQTGVAAFDEHRFSASRLSYWESWVAWHRRWATTGKGDLRMPARPRERPFPAPQEFLPAEDTSPLES